MDRRNTGPAETAYQRDLKLQRQQGAGGYNDKVIENGIAYRVPYGIVKTVVFKNIRKDELIDLEHAARLQYRLLLNDAVLKAKVEFAKLMISITYNPDDAENLKEKISIEGIIDFLAGEGIHVDTNSMSTADFDYYNEMYRRQFDPPSIREHPPYTYTQEEWKRMKPAWEEKVRKSEEKKLAEFHEWENRYAELHPEMKFEKIPVSGKRPSLLGRIMGRNGRKAGKDEKGFWFHGI